MKKTILTLLFVILIISVNLFAQKNNNIEKVYLLDKNDFNPYIEFTSSDIKDYFNPQNSSKYPSINLFDGLFKTCWIAGNSKTDVNFSLYMKVPKKIDLNTLIINIFSGYGKSKSLYKANARPKKIRISLYRGLQQEGLSTEVSNLYMIKFFTSRLISLKDSFGVQSFPLHIQKGQLKTLKSVIMKIEIVDVYAGSKYDDICISEIFFNDRFVTKYPSKYNEIEDVSIEDDNTLLLDYKHKKKIIILKDETSVFTMVDYIEKSNWAILHYVPNDTLESMGRVEEQYALIDLKNKKIVNKELKICTGNSPFLIEKSKNGKIFLITNTGEYEIELK